MVRLSVDALVASQVDGLFPYGFDFMADTPIEANRVSAQNLIRQALTAFALARYYEQAKDERLREPIRNALSAFGRYSLPIGKGDLQRAVEATRIFSLPVGRWKLQSTLDRLGLLYRTSGSGKVVSPDGKYGHALAGTVALALLTETIYSRASRDADFAALRLTWLEGLLSLRIPAGGFRQHPLSIDETDYDNGEAWLALAVYVDAHRADRRAVEALEDLDAALMRRYSEAPSIYLVGWGGMAAAQRFATTRDAKFLRYLQRQADLFLERFERQLNDQDNNCAAMEGVAATLGALKVAGESDTARVRELRAWLMDELRKLPRLQIQPGQKALALGGDAHLEAPRMARYAGAFFAGLYDPLTRVDAAGHCLSAMVTIEREKLTAP